MTVKVTETITTTRECCQESRGDLVNHDTTRPHERVCKHCGALTITPGEGYRWLDADETVLPTDEIFMPGRREEIWVPVSKVASGASLRTAGYYAEYYEWAVRRMLTVESESSCELLDALQELYDFATVSYGKNHQESKAAFEKAGAVLRKYRTEREH